MTSFALKTKFKDKRIDRIVFEKLFLYHWSWYHRLLKMIIRSSEGLKQFYEKRREIIFFVAIIHQSNLPNRYSPMFDDISHTEIPDIVHHHLDYSESNKLNWINFHDRFDTQNMNYVCRWFSHDHHPYSISNCSIGENIQSIA